MIGFLLGSPSLSSVRFRHPITLIRYADKRIFNTTCNEIVHRKEQLANRIKTIPLQMFTFFKFTFAKRRIKCSTLFFRGEKICHTNTMQP